MQRTVKNRAAARARWIVGVAAAGAVMASEGCYRYTSFTPDVARDQAQRPEVRVELTDAGASLLERQLGVGATIVDGTMVALDSTSMTVVVTQIQRRNLPEEFVGGERVAIPINATRSMLVRKLDGPMTILTAVGSLGVIALAHVVSNDGGIGGSKPSVPSQTR